MSKIEEFVKKAVAHQQKDSTSEKAIIELKKAVEAYNESDDDQYNFVYANYLLMWIYANKHDIKNAVPYANKCLEILIPQRSNLFHFTPEGQFKEEALRYASNTVAWNGLENAKNEADLEKALETIEIGVNYATESKYFYVIDTQVRILLKLGRQNEAFRIVSQCLREDSSFSDFQDIKVSDDFREWKQNEGEFTDTERILKEFPQLTTYKDAIDYYKKRYNALSLTDEEDCDCCECDEEDEDCECECYCDEDNDYALTLCDPTSSELLEQIDQEFNLRLPQVLKDFYTTHGAFTIGEEMDTLFIFEPSSSGYFANELMNFAYETSILKDYLQYTDDFTKKLHDRFFFCGLYRMYYHNTIGHWLFYDRELDKFGIAFLGDDKDTLDSETFPTLFGGGYSKYTFDEAIYTLVKSYAFENCLEDLTDDEVKKYMAEGLIVSFEAYDSTYYRRFKEIFK